MEGLPDHEKETRPWGTFETFTRNRPSTVKIITVKAGEAFSLQTHELRDEFWRVLSGSGIFRVGEEDREVKAGDDVFIPRGTIHRATAGSEDLTFLEVALGEAKEEDIVRYDDRYGRA